jgi:hypothetical protein
VINNGPNVFLFYACNYCDNEEKEKAKEKKKLKARDPVASTPRVDISKNYITFTKYLIAAGHHALLSISYSNSSQSSEALLIPISPSQALVYSFSSSYFSLRKLLESLKVQFLRPASKENFPPPQRLPKNASTTSLMRTSSIDPILNLKKTQESKYKKLESLLTTAKRNSISHEKHLQGLLHESSSVQNNPNDNNLKLSTSSAGSGNFSFSRSVSENSFSKINNFEYSQDAFPMEETNQSIVPEEEKSLLFPSLATHSEEKIPATEVKTHESLYFYTSATGLDDQSRLDSFCYGENNSQLLLPEGISVIQYPNFDESTRLEKQQSNNKTLTDRTTAVSHMCNFKNDESLSATDSPFMGLFGKVISKAQSLVSAGLSLLRPNSMTHDEKIAALCPDRIMNIDGGTNLSDELFSEESHTKDSTQILEKILSIESTGTNGQIKHCFGLMTMTQETLVSGDDDNDDAGTVSTMQDDIPEDLQVKLPLANQITEQEQPDPDAEKEKRIRDEKIQFQSNILNHFPKFKEFPSDIQNILLDCIVSKSYDVVDCSAKVFSRIFTGDESAENKVKSTKAGKKKNSLKSSEKLFNELNGHLKDILKQRIGNNSQLIYCFVLLAIIQIFTLFEYGTYSLSSNIDEVKTTETQRKLEEKLFMFLEHSFQRLSLAVGSPFFHRNELSGLIPFQETILERIERTTNNNQVMQSQQSEERELNQLYQSHFMRVLVQFLKEKYSVVFESKPKFLEIVAIHDPKNWENIISPEKTITFPLPLVDQQKQNLFPENSSLFQTITNETNVKNVLSRTSSAPFLDKANHNNSNTTIASSNNPLLTKKQPVIGHRMNMGTTRAITYLPTAVNNSSFTAGNNASRLTATSKTSQQSIVQKNNKLKNDRLSGNKRNISEAGAPSQKHLLFSPVPVKKSKPNQEISNTLFSPTLAFGTESFLSPEKPKSRATGKIFHKTIIEATPVQEYAAPQTFLSSSFDDFDQEILFD